MVISCASVELPPLPNASSRPPAENRPAMSWAAGPQPGRVAGADLAPQRGDLGGLGHGGGPDLLHHRVQISLARVENGYSDSIAAALALPDVPPGPRAPRS